MKMKKGKVYPSPPPPPPSSSSSSPSDVPLPFMKLLPATILVLVSVLSAEDKQVLAYLITRGTTNPSSSGDSNTTNKKKTKSLGKNHKPPVPDCECFDCYTSYWFRWDSSPNRELIHQIIEAFEDSCETSSSNNSSNNNKSKKGKKKEKSGRRVGDINNKPGLIEPVAESHVSLADVAEREPKDGAGESTAAVVPVAAASGHKGLARKVLPDVLGLFHSNFWRLWNPNA